MPKPTPIPVRRAMHKFYQDGWDAQAVAERLQRSARTVRHFFQRFRERSEAGLETAYPARAQAAVPPDTNGHVRRPSPCGRSTRVGAEP